MATTSVGLQHLQETFGFASDWPINFSHKDYYFSLIMGPAFSKQTDNISHGRHERDVVKPKILFTYVFFCCFKKCVVATFTGAFPSINISVGGLSGSCSCFS